MGTPTTSAARLAVLMLHDVEGAEPARGYAVSRARLREILAIAKRAGPVRFLVTFDDGHLGTVERGLPELLQAGIVATLFVTTDFVGRPGYVDRSRLRQWVDSGQGLGSHAVTHRPLSLLSEADAVSELTGSRARLEDWTGRPATSFAFPGGNETPRLRELALASGYDHVYTSEPGFAIDADRVRKRFTVRGATPVAAVERLARGRWSPSFVVDGIRFRMKRGLGAGPYRTLRALVRGARRPGGGA